MFFGIINSIFMSFIIEMILNVSIDKQSSWCWLIVAKRQWSEIIKNPFDSPSTRRSIENQWTLINCNDNCSVIGGTQYWEGSGLTSIKLAPPSCSIAVWSQDFTDAYLNYIYRFSSDASDTHNMQRKNQTKSNCCSRKSLHLTPLSLT